MTRQYKCSKKPGEYCRLHNPAPASTVDSFTSGDDVFKKALDKKVENSGASAIPAPEFKFHLRIKDLTEELTEWKKERNDILKANDIDPRTAYVVVENRSIPDLNEAEKQISKIENELEELTAVRNRLYEKYADDLIASEFKEDEKALAKHFFLGGLQYPTEFELDNEEALKEARQKVIEPDFAARLARVEYVWYSQHFPHKDITKANIFATYRKAFAEAEGASFSEVRKLSSNAYREQGKALRD